MIELAEEARVTAGIVLLTIVTIEAGGGFLVAVATGKVPATEFQRRFFRAGHAHAGVLVLLGLVCLLLAEVTALEGAWLWLARTGVLVAAVLMPMGFFFSAMGRDRTRPNRAVWLLPVGAAVLAAGVLTLGIGLLTA
ncbi:hypothetical protein [Actinotalea fermentans]|uniref:Integral membrane protein n=1 Tax=Actinotalea fermentans TaxID=43671 RepID=A0A511YVX5_9CELL|nr:hypothetical protein [Actinotalea fermentans]KGM15544.1 hypothetical protein N867_07625 [Actinotalea fermentans ATCC 43279 = JCM 9966 = DSM 3133]GEN79296.1 hypothetical protein AFE02nite_10300 [Actinotalea fermentans]